MTLIEAAALLGVTAATLRQQIANGKLRARKVGRDWSVSRREVERYGRYNRRDAAHERRETWHTGPHGSCKRTGEHTHA